MLRQPGPATSSPSRLFSAGPCGPCPSRSEPRIPAAFAARAPAAAQPRFRKRSTAQVLKRQATAAESACHPGSYTLLPAPVAAQTLQTSSPSAPLLQPAQRLPVVHAAELLHPAAVPLPPNTAPSHTSD